MMTKDERHALIDYLVLLNWAPTRLMGVGPMGWRAAVHNPQIDTILFVDKEGVHHIARVSGFNRESSWDSMSSHDLILFEKYIREKLT